MSDKRIYAVKTSADPRLVAVALFLALLVFGLELIRLGPLDTTALDAETALIGP